MRVATSNVSFVFAAALAVTVAMAGVATPVAHADDAAAINQMKQLARQAMENYDLMEYEEAKKQFNKAILVAKKNRLSDHPLTAQLYLHLGIVFFSGFQDVESAKVAFIDAVSIDPNISLNPAYKTPDMGKLLAEAKADFGGGSGADSAPKPKPKRKVAKVVEPVRDDVDCGALVGISHTLVDSGHAGTEQPVEAHVSPELGASKISLFYRSKGKADFVEVAMEKRGSCGFVGNVPADAMVGDVLHYYVAVFNDGGKIIAKKGSSASPNIMELATAGGSSSGTGGDDFENPLGGGRRAASSSSGGEVSGGVTTEPGAYKKIFVSVTVGSGGGLYFSGSPETEQARQSISKGFAPAPVHVMPEVGYRLSAKNAVGLAFRMGLTPGANIMGHATGAPAVLGRFHHNLDASGEGLAVHGALGGGIIRQQVPLANGDEVDTAALGPLFIGAGVGYQMALSGSLKLVAELAGIYGIAVKSELGDCSGGAGSVCTPINSALQVDASLGLQMGF